jgi:peptidoglycan/xylan/chitin deacetylase (PgdA/CDA1 family)
MPGAGRSAGTVRADARAPTRRGRAARTLAGALRGGLVAAALAGAAGASSGVPLLRLPARPPARTLRLPILMYHRIDAVKPSLPAITQRLTVDPRVFAAQMRWLKAHGYHAVTQLQAFRALEQGAPLPRRPIMITFDDGYRDVLGKASPILERLGMPATAYVITDRISGPDPSFLTWGNLRALEQRGIAIGSHTVHHLELTRLGDEQALAELADSRRLLERKLGHPVQWFAYPGGAEDPRVVALVRAAGYVLAVTTEPGAVQSAADPLTLHRYEVLDTTGVAGLAALLGSSG